MSSPNPTSPALIHGEIASVFDDIFFVRGAWVMPLPLRPRISRSMTILRDPATGDLTLVNSMRLSEAGLASLEALGTVRHVIRLASMHGADDAFYRDRYGAKIWALEGSFYSRGLTADASPEENYFEADAFFDSASDLPIQNASVHVMKSPRLIEASVLLQRDGGILLSGDYFHNTPRPDEFTNGIASAGMRLFGLARPCNIGVGWAMMTKPSRQDFLSLLDLEFEHVLPIHGVPAIGNAKERYRPAIEKFAKKAWVAGEESQSPAGAGPVVARH